MPDEDTKLPKETSGDHAHALVRAGLGVIPFGGTAAIELFNKVVTPPLERRRDRWRETVGERLQILEDAKTVDIESLQENEAFATVMMQASHAALRNHEVEKLEALRNAVLNAALPSPPTKHSNRCSSTLSMSSPFGTSGYFVFFKIRPPGFNQTTNKLPCSHCPAAWSD